MIDSNDQERFSRGYHDAVTWLAVSSPIVFDTNAFVQRGSLRQPTLSDSADVGTTVCDILRQRSAILQDCPAIPASSTAIARGRVLLLFIDWNLFDGAAFDVGAGLFDDQNVPLCDLWIGLFDVVLNGSAPVRALASWIPENYQQFAQRAVDVNPEQCLRWADEVAADWLQAMEIRT